MNKKENEAFEAVRNEDVVLWMGSGMSRYAGYKSGEELANLIFLKLTVANREGINKNDLQRVSKAYERQFSRKSLIEFLKNEFIVRSPSSTKHHKTLSQIPHIRTVVTTNYDTLIEDSFNGKGQVIYNDHQFTSLDKNKVRIIKIHGDVKEKGSIVITNTDYEAFLANRMNSIMSIVVSGKIATMTHIFVGYSLEDINIITIFNKVWESIKESKKSCYFVAPKIPKSKKADLREKGIKYIDSTGEGFIDRLYANCMENLVEDFKLKRIGAETLRSSFRDNGGLVVLKDSKDGGLAIDSVGNLNGSSNSNISFQFVNEEVANKYTEFRNGQILEEVRITSDEIKNFLFAVGKIPLLKGDSFELRIKPNALYKGKCNIRFLTTGFEYRGIAFEVFATNKIKKVVGTIKCGKIEIEVRQDEFNYKIHYKIIGNDNYGSISDEIEYYNLLLNLSGGGEIVFEFDGGEKTKINIGGVNSDHYNDAEMRLNYFKGLRRIEDHYDFFFDKVDSINSKTISIMESIMAYLDQTSIYTKFTDTNKTVKFSISDYNETILNLNEELGEIVIETQTQEIVALHGQEMEIGYKRVKLLDLVVLNLADVKSKKAKEVELRSNSGEVEISYVNEVDLRKNN